MSDEDAIQDLVGAWLEAFDAGRDTPVSELCASRPELAAEVARRVDEIRRVAALVRAVNAPCRAPTVTAPQHGPTGVTRLDKFVLGLRLGKGGMGEVYRARDPELGRDVAIKIMSETDRADPKARARFLREARAAAAVRHDNVVEIYHVGEDAGRPYLVMPVLQGEPLDARLKREKVLSADEVARIGREAAEGLAAAHAAGLVHRDIKPSNLWIEAPTGRVKVLDFGLARVADGTDLLTRPGAVMGTLAYMSPEQARGEVVDARSDLFSLGAVLYEAATGVRPFRGNSQSAVLLAVTSHDPPTPREVNPSVPEWLSLLISRLLSKDLAKRYGTAREAAEDMLAHSAPELPPPARRRKWLPVLAAVVLLVGVGVAIRAGTGGSGQPAAAGPQAGPSVTGVPAAPAEPLRVAALDVYHYAKTGPDEATATGVLGTTAVVPKLGDQVTVRAKLSRPAFGYLVGFGPDGVMHLLTEDRTKTKTDRLLYPTTLPEKDDAVRYGLTDGAGLYVFAVVASDDPLPPFEAIKGGGKVLWTPGPVPAGDVLSYDGAWAEYLLVKGVRPTGSPDRGPGEKALGPGRLVVQPADSLRRALGGGVVAAVGVGVGN